MRKRLIEKNKKNGFQLRQPNDGTGQWQLDLNSAQQQQTEKHLKWKSSSNQQHFRTNNMASKREQQQQIQQQQCRVANNETKRQEKTRDEAEVQRLVGKYDITTFYM